MKIPENKPIKNPNQPPNSLKPQPNYYGPNYYQNNTKNYQSYLNEIPVQSNLPSNNQYLQNQTSAVKISMNPNLHKKPANTLSHDHFLNNRLSASRA